MFTLWEGRPHIPSMPDTMLDAGEKTEVNKTGTASPL